MKVTVTIELGNDAMRTADDVAWAIDESFRRHGTEKHGLEGQGMYATLEAGDGRAVLDGNGNTVGEWTVTE